MAIQEQLSPVELAPAKRRLLEKLLRTVGQQPVQEAQWYLAGQLNRPDQLHCVNAALNVTVAEMLSGPA
jgi:hypothetical protein